MQNSKNKARSALILTAIYAVIFIALRIALLYNNYDFEEGFFIKRSFATAFYILLCLVVFILIIFKKKFSPLPTTKRYAFLSFFDILLAISFVFLVISLNSDTQAYTFYLIFALFSVVSYLFTALKKEKNTLTSILNIAPLFFFLLRIVLSFISVSGKANSYNSFMDIAALIAIAFFILYEGKPTSSEEYPSVYTSILAGILTLAPSVIPDIVTVITKDMTVTLDAVAIITVKLFYLMKMTAKAVTANISEDK